MAQIDLDLRLTRKHVAEAVGVRPETVGMWKVRGHLDTDEHGLYRLGDVLRAELKTRYSPNNRRTAPGGNGRIRVRAA